MPAGRVVLGGFSQGGAMSLFTGLRYREALAGVICMSAYLPLAETLDAEASAENRGVPIFMAHGTADATVDIGFGRRSRDHLAGAGYTVDWREYPHGARDLRRGAERHRPLAVRRAVGDGGMTPRAVRAGAAGQRPEVDTGGHLRR